MAHETSDFDNDSFELIAHEYSLQSLAHEIPQEDVLSIPTDIQEIIHNSYASSTAMPRREISNNTTEPSAPEAPPAKESREPSTNNIKTDTKEPSWMESYNLYALMQGERFSIYMPSALKRAILDEARERDTTPTTAIKMAIYKAFPDAIGEVYPDQVRYELDRKKYENGQIDQFDWNSKMAEKFYASTEKEERTQISFELPYKLANFLHEKANLNTSLLNTNELITTSLEYEFDEIDDIHLFLDSPDIS